MEERHYFMVLSLLMVLFIGCEATTTGIKRPAFEISNSLSPEKLAYYNDAFDRLSFDLWEKAALTFTPSQLANFKPADMDIEGGKLRIKTQKGHFSKGGLVSKYVFRGGFDVQVDCQMNFLQKTVGMDQGLVLTVLEKQKETEMPNSAIIGLAKRQGRKSTIYTIYYENSKPVQRKCTLWTASMAPCGS